MGARLGSAQIHNSTPSESSEWIQASLFPDGGAGAMAADDQRRAGESEELAPDGREDGLGVAAPEVRPADGTAEEGVAGEENRYAALQKETGRAGRVHGGVERAH